MAVGGLILPIRARYGRSPRCTGTASAPPRVCRRRQGVRVLVKPSPIELTTPINPERGIEGQRNLFCVHYDGCLDEAVKQGWNSWCCSACGLATAEPDEAAGIDGYATQRRFV
jgi:hypothetical protein